MAQFNPVRIVPTQYGTNSLHFINPAGRRRRIAVGKDYQYAQRLAVRFNDWLLDGKDPEAEYERARQTERSRNLTLRSFYPVFMERHGLNQSESMQEIFKYRFLQICRCPELADIPLKNISRRLVRDYMQARVTQDGVSNATANREAAMLKNMLFRAVEWDYLERNPIQGMRLLPEAEKRQVSLSPKQVGDLLTALPESLAEIVEFAVYTGFRKENILGLRVEAFRVYDLTSGGEVDLTVKGGRREVFPISARCQRLLERVISGRKNGYVFVNPGTGSRYTSISHTFDRVVRNLGLTVNGTKLRFHDLRHVHATWLYETCGVPLDGVRTLLGHRHRDTTDRYITYDRRRFIDALDRLPDVKTGKNWQGQGEQAPESTPPLAVSS